MTILKKAVLWSLPIWAFLILDTILMRTRMISLLSQYIHSFGLALLIVIDPSENLHDPSYTLMCAINCVFYSLIVWFVVFLVDRMRRRRTAKGQA